MLALTLSSTAVMDTLAIGSCLCCRKLGVEEAARQEIQSREATAMEKVSLAEEERAKER